MASYKELTAQIEALKQQAEAVRKSEIAGVVAQIKAKMTEFGLTIADLAGGGRGVRKGAVVAPKYRNPATGETWTGRGKQPRWLSSEISAGKTLESFLL